MSDLVYLVEGRTTKPRPELRDPGPGKHLELMVEAGNETVVVVDKPKKPALATKAFQRTTAQRKRKRRRTQRRKQPAPVKPTRVVKVLEDKPRKPNEIPYFAGNGDMLVKFYIGNMAPRGPGRVQRIAYASVLDGMGTGISFSRYNLRLGTSLKLTDEGFYRAREYLMEIADPYQVSRKRRKRKKRKKEDSIVIEDYKGHGFLIKRRERVVVVQTPMVFELDDLVECDSVDRKVVGRGNNSRTILKPWDSSKRTDIYNALVTAYQLLEPVLMKDIEGSGH